MAQGTHYAQSLRAIGQALEILRLENFEMAPEGENFLIRGTVVVRNVSSEEREAQQSRVRYIWGLLPGQKTVEPGVKLRQRPLTVARLDLCYTQKDLDRLEREGQAKRSNPQGMADAASLSQLLRTVGAYVNEKRARLLKVSRDGEPVRVEYETSSGAKFEEVFAVSDLYDFWLRMYMKRAGRNEH